PRPSPKRAPRSPRPTAPAPSTSPARTSTPSASSAPSPPDSATRSLRSMRSFLDVSPESHFSIHNLPYGVFSRPDQDGPRVGVALGDRVVDLAVLQRRGLFDAVPEVGEADAFAQPALNAFMALGRPVWQA